MITLCNASFKLYDIIEVLSEQFMVIL